MTTFQVYIDGWPFLVEFEGTIEIARTWDGETVAIRGGPVKSVMLDEVELARARAECAKKHAETSRLIGLIDDAYNRSWMGIKRGDSI